MLTFLVLLLLIAAVCGGIFVTPGLFGLLVLAALIWIIVEHEHGPRRL